MHFMRNFKMQVDFLSLRYPFATDPTTRFLPVVNCKILHLPFCSCFICRLPSYAYTNSHRHQLDLRARPRA
uniref:Uncharacterized protein n=1 Tax=Hyaloperonospora arabidopsidis (strain Emoy2) TaxID=559515 RepID=M4B1M1_HYAAE